MAKRVKVTLERYHRADWGDMTIRLADGKPRTVTFCWDHFKEACPALCKGLRAGASRELVLTQTGRGIKLERVPKRS